MSVRDGTVFECGYDVDYVESVEIQRQIRINALQELARAEALHVVDQGERLKLPFLMAGAFERDLEIAWSPMTGALRVK